MQRGFPSPIHLDFKYNRLKYFWTLQFRICWAIWNITLKAVWKTRFLYLYECLYFPLPFASLPLVTSFYYSTDFILYAIYFISTIFLSFIPTSTCSFGLTSWLERYATREIWELNNLISPVDIFSFSIYSIKLLKRDEIS